ncbi:MAG: GNAT family N-acetyltransferase [Sphingomonas sp.]
MPVSLLVRLASHLDLGQLHPLIERGYRGDSARLGWTHEADLVEGDRTDIATLQAIIDDPAQRLLVALEGDRVIGCVVIAHRGGGLAYLGMLCVDPVLQSAGIGRKLVSAAEEMARESFRARTIEMTVIENRTELIAWYRRQDYAPSGESRDFPVPLDPPLFMTVLVKPL